ncbi:MAG: ABC transporter permease, partial [Wenzhouxiangella sp.]
LTVRIPSLLPSDVPVLAGIGMDGRVLAFALLATIAAAAISGVLPAIRAARGNTAGALASGRQGGDVKSNRISQSLVAVQITLAVVLSIGAGLALKTLAAFSSIDPGFEPANVITARLDPVPDPLRSPATVRSMQEALIERVRALPEVRQAGLTSVAPLEGIGADFTAFDILHDRQDQGNLPLAHFPHISPGYLDAMGVELIEGRLFDATDRNDSLPVAVLSQSLAERYFTDGNAIGGQIGQPWSDNWWTVIGVVRDVYYEALDQSGQFAIYRPLAQAPRETVVLAVRSPADPRTVASALRNIVNELDVEVAVSRLQTGQQRLAQS